MDRTSDTRWRAVAAAADRLAENLGQDGVDAAGAVRSALAEVRAVFFPSPDALGLGALQLAVVLERALGLDADTDTDTEAVWPLPRLQPAGGNGEAG